MEINFIVCSLNQLKIGLWEDMRLLLGNTEVQNQWKYTLQVLGCKRKVRDAWHVT